DLGVESTSDSRVCRQRPRNELRDLLVHRRVVVVGTKPAGLRRRGVCRCRSVAPSCHSDGAGGGRAQMEGRVSFCFARRDRVDWSLRCLRCSAFVLVAYAACVVELQTGVWVDAGAVRWMGYARLFALLLIDSIRRGR